MGLLVETIEITSDPHRARWVDNDPLLISLTSKPGETGL